MNTKSKFKCNSVEDYGNGHRTAKFSAVCADEIPENQRYHKWTPSGEIRIEVTNPDVVFKPGASYYVDFTEVES